MTRSLERARAGDERAFRELTDPYRRELQLHCYRILGSLQDAEDALQETLVAAWRGLDRFEQRASMRTWLYRIATNRCLNVLREGSRRPLSTSGLPFVPPPPTSLSEISWLEPYPDALLEDLPDRGPGPDARYELRESVGLAFITALQRLPVRQRAVLVLRDVLGFRSAEVAELLDVTEATVNSALQRARSALEARASSPRDRVPAPDSAHERAVAAAFADAFEQGNLDRVVQMLTDDALVAMPPEPQEYRGPVAVANFFRHATTRREAGAITNLVPTRANGQPAFGHYVAADLAAPVVRGVGMFVLALEGERIAEIIRFDGAQLLPRFGLPLELEARR